MKRFCSLVVMLLVSSAVLADGIDSPMQRFNLGASYVPVKAFAPELPKSVALAFKQSRISAFTTNAEYGVVWDKETHTLKLTDTIGIGSMRHIDLAHGVGLGYNVSNSTRLWISHGKNRVTDEKLTIIAIEHAFK